MSHVIDKYRDIALSQIHEFDGYYIFMRKDGIMQLLFKAGFSGDVENAIKMILTFKKISPDKKVLALVIYHDDNTFTKETREFIASEEVSETVAVDALVIKGLALRIIGNGYLRINRPNRPTRIFNSVESALKWLEQFLNDK